MPPDGPEPDRRLAPPALARPSHVLWPGPKPAGSRHGCRGPVMVCWQRLRRIAAVASVSAALELAGSRSLSRVVAPSPSARTR